MTSQKKNSHTLENKFIAVSLFSNCGAGDHGYKKSGFEFSVMAELEEKRLEVSLLNHKTSIGISGDLRETWANVISEFRRLNGNKRPALLAACPPCQGMSSARGAKESHDNADAGSNDKRNLLAIVIGDVAKALQPRMIVVENVPHFLTKKVRHPRTRKAISAANLLIEELEADYYAFPIILDLCNFGVPQTRKRSFLTFIDRREPALAKLLSLNLVPFPKQKKHIVTIAEALRRMNKTSLQATKSGSGSGMHSVPVWSASQIAMVRAIPRGSGKSAWDNNTCLKCHFISASSDTHCFNCETLLPKPIVKENGETYRLIKGFKTSYKRIQPNSPSSTILTSSGSIGSHNTIHPFEHRVLSIAECAGIQTLNSDFKWGDTLKKYGPTNVRKMIGEAVPPLFTKEHGSVLLQVLENEINPKKLLPTSHVGVRSAKKKLLQTSDD